MSDRMLSLYRHLRRSSLRQIDAALAAAAEELAATQLSILDREILKGQQRELRAARWLVNRVLLPGDEISAPDQPTTTISALPIRESNVIAPPTSDLASGASLALQPYLFDAIAAKLTRSLQNLDVSPLEIDILKADKKRELFQVILHELEHILGDLRAAEIDPTQLQARLSTVLQDLWQAVVTNFFGRYFTISLLDSGNDSINNGQIDAVPVILNEAKVIQVEVLDRIPLVAELCAHLLFQTPLEIDNVSYAVGTTEAMQRSQILLENLVIQLANAVVQPLLNNFADVEAIKQKFYDYQLITTREIERFRNDLSWWYRRDRYFDQPKAIFESQFPLLTLSDRGIKKIYIYAPRTQELRQLSGLRFWVTVGLEFQDAIAPRLRAAVSFLGSGLVYVLTEIIGRGLGLIARGILQGIGSAWQVNKEKGKGRKEKVESV